MAFSIVFGHMMIAVGIAMLAPFALALIDQDGTAHVFIACSGVCSFIGFLLRRRPRIGQFSPRHSFLVVTLSWILVSLLGALPFALTGVVPSGTDAFFEAVSGVTTTGATVIRDLANTPRSILLWRSLLQWLGGMGFIVLSLAFLPGLSSGQMDLFKAEIPNPLPERIKPRLKDTALSLWKIYVSMTALLFILLIWGGLPWFDAVIIALSTLPSGGFSPQSASISAYNNVIVELILVVFMVIVGTNFTLFYRAYHSRSLRAIINDTEFRTYIGIFTVASAVVTSYLWAANVYSLPKALRYGVFQVISIMTTTAFVSADFHLWPGFVSMILFLLMFVGGSAGSTSGSMKVLRHLIAAKYGQREMFRLIHPRAVRPIRVGDHTVSESAVSNILAFIMMYFALFVVGTLLLAAMGLDAITAVSAAGSAIGNVGLGWGKIGSMENFAFLSAPVKWVLSFLMIVGRLEIFTVLVLVLPGVGWGYRPRR